MPKTIDHSGRPEGRVTLWAVEVFVALAEERAISAAARRLGASASAVSQQLAGLGGGSWGRNVLDSVRPGPWC